MRTLGIDLASQPRQTAACAIHWAAGRAEVERIEVRLDDGALVERISRADLTGIDAPFGWPAPFVAWLMQAHGGAPVADRGTVPAWTADHLRHLRFRATDHVVRERMGRWPLGVATDLISVVAMRCTGLLQRLGVGDKLGGDGVVEVYPALALRLWAMPAVGYKGTGNAETRRRLLRDALLPSCPWLTIAEPHLNLCVRSDHALDALISSLTVRCFAAGEVEPIPEAHLAAARTEGWIVLPRRDALVRLVP